MHFVLSIPSDLNFILKKKMSHEWGWGDPETNARENQPELPPGIHLRHEAWAAGLPHFGGEAHLESLRNHSW